MVMALGALLVLGACGQQEVNASDESQVPVTTVDDMEASDSDVSTSAVVAEDNGFESEQEAILLELNETRWEIAERVGFESTPTEGEVFFGELSLTMFNSCQGASSLMLELHEDGLRFADRFGLEVDAIACDIPDELPVEFYVPGGSLSVQLSEDGSELALTSGDRVLRLVPIT